MWEDTHVKFYDPTSIRREENSQPLSQQQDIPAGQDNLKNKLVYTDDKFGVTFSYDPSHPLKDPNRVLDSSDFSIDAIGNGRVYRCPLVEGGLRAYTEKEVTDGNVNVTGCTYEAPNLDLAAQGQFSASWSKEVYGVGKNIKDITVAGRPAKLVYGSTKVRTLIVSLSSPYTENGYKYDFLLLQGDESLMSDIISTFKFLK